MARTAHLLAAALGAILAVRADAQSTAPIQVPTATTFVTAQAMPPVGPDIPQPPRAMLSLPDHAPAPRLPVGSGTRPQPSTPEAVIFDPRIDTGDSFKTIREKPVQPTGANPGMTCEPSVAFADANNVFYTGNWFGASSTDGGVNWTNRSPFSIFPASAGGFCCDQRVLSSGGLTIWYLQYDYDASGNNLGRIGVFKTPAAVGAGAPDYYFDVTAQNFGWASGIGFDFPDVAADDTSFYFSTNVTNTSPGGVAFRIAKSTLAGGSQGSPIQITYSTNSFLGGNNYRFTQEATDEMFFADLVDTTTTRVYRWTASGLSFVDVTVAQWSDATGNSILANGRNWAARGVRSKVLGGWVTLEEVGFTWVSAPVGNVPTEHVRVMRVRRSDRTLIDEHKIWNADSAILYPAAASNANGQVSVTAAIGGPTRSPSPIVTIYDDASPFSQSPVIYVWAQSTADPDQDRWGDYFTINRHPTEPMSWYCSGHRMNGGSTAAFVQPRFLHFCREAFEPGFGGLVVRSVPDGAAITVSVADRFAEQDGTAPFYRSYAIPSGTVSVTAPASFVAADGETYVFERWATQGNLAETLTPTLRPVGQRTFGFGAVDSNGRLAEARYRHSTPGTVTPLGAGCPGSNGQAPAHSVLSGAQGPQLGAPIDFRVANARPGTGAFLMIGFDTTAWGAFPLPLNLGILGAPQCTLYHDLVLTVGTATSASGVGSVQVQLAENPAAIGAVVHTSFAVLDPGSNALGFAFSSALTVTLGGLD